jgi:hypothetical protein
VEYLRYPGNAYDRQYAKFCQPFGQYREDQPAELRFRLGMASLITRYRQEVLRQQIGTHTPG